TALVTLRFDNAAMATAEASFHAVYGYDIRGEVFGSAGMVTIGDGRRSTMTLHDAGGRSAETMRSNVELFHDAYTEQLAHFVRCVRARQEPEVTGDDARAALAIALAAIHSIQSGRRVAVPAVADDEPNGTPQPLNTVGSEEGSHP